MPNDVHFGNALQDGERYRGWLVGHFIHENEPDVRRTEDIDVKWFFHPAGQQRKYWVTGETATTLCMLIRGCFRIDLSSGTYTPANEADYLMWGPVSTTSGAQSRTQRSSRSTGALDRLASRPAR